MTKNIGRIDYSQTFIKQLNKAPLEIKKSFRKRLALFIEDQHSQLLRNHLLSGRLKHFRSININGDWRALYCKVSSSEETLIIFEMMGIHSQLYQ